MDYHFERFSSFALRIDSRFLNSYQISYYMIQILVNFITIIQSIWIPKIIVIFLLFLLLLNLLWTLFFLVRINNLSIFLLFITFPTFTFEEILFSTHLFLNLCLSLSFCFKHFNFKCLFPNHKVLYSYRSICRIFGSFKNFS